MKIGLISSFFEKSPTFLHVGDSISATFNDLIGRGETPTHVQTLTGQPVLITDIVAPRPVVFVVEDKK